MPTTDTAAARTRRPVRNEDAQPFVSLESIERSSGDAIRFVREQVEQRPYATLGTALAAGYILGGGLSLRLATALVGIAGRVALAQMVSGALRGLQPANGRTNA